MKDEYESHLKAIYIRLRETDDVFVFRGVASVDEIQPERAEQKRAREAERSQSGRLSGRKLFTRGVTLGLLLLAFTFASGIGATRQTLSYFNDLENASGNNLNAALLDFTVNAVEYSGEVVVGETGIMFDPTASGEPGSLQLEYKVAAEKISGSDTFCNALVATASGSLAYIGPLVSLSAGPTVSVGVYEVGITMPDDTGVVDGDVCVVDLVYTGWYQNAPDEEGYVDEERVTLTLTANIPELLIAPFSAPSFNFFSAPEGDAAPEEKIAEIPPAEEEGATSPEEGAEPEEIPTETPILPEVPDPNSLIPDLPEIPNAEIPEIPVIEEPAPEIPEIPEIIIPEIPEPLPPIVE